jgi:nitrogenase molybdenum-iron protein alpha chain
MGKRILYALENDEFLINLKKHTVTAYTKWWLDQSPDTFLK